MRLLEIWNNPTGPSLAYAEYGDPDGFPVIFTHGWPGSRLQMRPAHELASARGLRVISVERPGIGRSEAQPGRKVTDWPPLVEGLADHLGLERFHLLTESGGCPYTLATAAALPERVGRVVICCGAPPLAEFEDWSELFWVFRFLLKVRRHARWAELAFITLGKWYLHALPGSWPMRIVLWSVPQADRQALGQEPHTTMIVETNREAYRHPRGVVADGSLFLEPWGFDYRSIRVPVAFWHGELDGTLPINMTRWLAEQIPGARFHGVPGEGHYSLPLNYMPDFLDWLKGAEAAPAQ